MMLIRVFECPPQPSKTSTAIAVITNLLTEQNIVTFTVDCQFFGDSAMSVEEPRGPRSFETPLRLFKVGPHLVDSRLKPVNNIESETYE